MNLLSTGIDNLGVARHLTFSLLILSAVSQVLLGQSSGDDAVGPFRTQNIQLDSGWNAVYLEVEPLDGDPAALFEGTPIEIAAGYFRPVTALEFVESPGEVLPDRKGWSVWYAPHRDDALLSNLYNIQAHHAYLIYVEEAYTWNLRGMPIYRSTQWHPNAFSLVGFPVDASGKPTLADFFAASKAHDPLKIYRLSGGKWALVTNPEAALMEPGAAYWAYSGGASAFSGPLKLQFDNSDVGGLVYTEQSGPHQLVFTNDSVFPQELTLSLAPGETGLLPVAYVLHALNGPNEPIEALSIPFGETVTMGPLEAGQSFALELEVIHDEVTLPIVSSTLNITSDAGVRLEVPMFSLRRDLLEP